MLYYIQDTRQYVGNSMLWWRKGGKGYTCEITDAEVFTAAQADEVCINDHYRRWPKPYIDASVSRHVDMQKVSIREADDFEFDWEEPAP